MTTHLVWFSETAVKNSFKYWPSVIYGVRYATALTVALLVVLAGCSGFVGDEPTGADPTTETPTTTDEPSEVAPGLSEDGVTDARELAEAHREALRGSSHTQLVEETIRDEDGEVIETVRSESRVAADGDRRHAITEIDSDPSEIQPFPYAEVEIWSNETTIYRQVTPNGTVEYHEGSELPSTWGTGRWHELHSLFGALDVTVEETDDGAIPDYRVETAEPAPSPDYPRDASNVSLTATVEPSGFVSEHTVEYETTLDRGDEREEQSVTITRTVTLADRGETTVREPDWVSEARNETGESAVADL